MLMLCFAVVFLDFAVTSAMFHFAFVLIDMVVTYVNVIFCSCLP